VDPLTVQSPFRFGSSWPQWYIDKVAKHEGQSVASSKQVAKEILESLPDDCSLEDISYHFYVRAKLEEGVRDLDEGRVVPHGQVMREAAEWLKKRKP
jgi:predicted transcriptional regulator